MRRKRWRSGISDEVGFTSRVSRMPKVSDTRSVWLIALTEMFCFFRQLMTDRIKRWIIPRQKSMVRNLILTWTPSWR